MRAIRTGVELQLDAPVGPTELFDQTNRLR
jgi:hypothetical protein